MGGDEEEDVDTNARPTGGMGDVPAALDRTNPTEWNAILRRERELVCGHQATHGATGPIR